MKELTKAEEQIMQILWDLEKGFVKDIVERFPEPKPAYNTVSTIVRILEQKGFVDHTAYGKTHEYFPLVGKSDYTRTFLPPVLLGVKSEVGQTGSLVVVINAENTAFVLNHKPYFFSFLRRCAMRLSMTDGLG